MSRDCVIGLPASRAAQLAPDRSLLVCETLPAIEVRGDRLLVAPEPGFAPVPVGRVVFHGIFEDDLDLLAGLALWGGPCFPDARAMMDCRLKLPCLVRALAHSRFPTPGRGYASRGISPRGALAQVAKWGNWHCGENKALIDEDWIADEPSIIEPLLEGPAARVVMIGERAWQIALAGDDWRHSIHHADAVIEPALDPALEADTRAIAAGMGLDLAACDYILTADGPRLLELNHIPNVTRFEPLWQAFREHVAAWLR